MNKLILLRCLVVIVGGRVLEREIVLRMWFLIARIR